MKSQMIVKCVIFDKTRCSAIVERPRWNWETIFYGHCRSIFNQCDYWL